MKVWHCLFFLMVFGMRSEVARAERHERCLDQSLNTYQHADCERKFAQKELDALNQVIADLIREDGAILIESEIHDAQSAFLNFVEKDCLLEGNAIFGTMGTYVFEECRSSYFLERSRRMSAFLDSIRFDTKPHR